MDERSFSAEEIAGAKAWKRLELRVRLERSARMVAGAVLGAGPCLAGAVLVVLR